jgi:hypothetical protein
MAVLLNPETERQPSLQGGLQPALPALLLDVRQAAAFLNVSASWVRRHAAELPVVRIGRLVRLDSVLLKDRYSANVSTSGKSLGKASMEIQRRYQSGSVFKRGKQKVWFGMFREDVRKADGTLERRQRKIRLGTLSELPTKYAAMNELQKYLALNSKPFVEMTFSELFEKWQEVVVPTLKTSTANVYTRALRSRILPTLGETPINKIGRYEIELFLAVKSEMYAKNTLRELRSSLSRVLSWAIQCDWLEKNPCIGVKLPNGTERDGRLSVPY